MFLVEKVKGQTIDGRVSLSASVHAWICGWLLLTFAEVADVFWEFQMCTAQRGREEAHRFQKGCVEAGDAAENGVSQQLCRGQPGGHGITSLLKKGKQHDCCVNENTSVNTRGI